MKKVNKDCPFSIEELDEFRAMLYSVNTFIPLLQCGSGRLGCGMAEKRDT